LREHGSVTTTDSSRHCQKIWVDKSPIDAAEAPSMCVQQRCHSGMALGKLRHRQDDQGRDDDFERVVQHGELTERLTA
jgi:hypothetical protein